MQRQEMHLMLDIVSEIIPSIVTMGTKAKAERFREFQDFTTFGMTIGEYLHGLYQYAR